MKVNILVMDYVQPLIIPPDFLQLF